LYLARIHDYVIATRGRIAVAAGIALAVAAGCKYAFVGVMLHEGASRGELELQDCLIAGLLAGVVAWMALVAAHIRQRQIREQVQTVADLNHHLRNALSIILNSHYLSTHEQKDAILAGVDRIDRALQQIVPTAASAGARPQPVRPPRPVANTDPSADDKIASD
jgi:hypothetical protein